MLVDYHCHVNFAVFKDDADEVIKRALEGSVFMILIGTQIDTSRRAIEIAEKYDKGVYASIALHPIHLEKIEMDKDEGGFTSRAEVFDFSKYKELALNKKVVAVGECGLDYHHTQSHDMQKKTFEQHLDLADDLELPVIIHCRGSKENPDDAYNDVLKILKQRQLKHGGAIHCFMSTLDIAQEFLKLGLYIGFTGVITFKNAPEYKEIIRELPLEKILVETDAPYLAPMPYRGKRNEPLYVRYVAEKIAEIKELDKEKVEKQLFENTLKLFKKIPASSR